MSSPDDIDREIHIEKLKHEIEDLTGNEFIIGGSGDVPPALEETFLEHVYAYEQATPDTTFNRLMKRGFSMEPPSELDDATLATRLQDLLRVLGEMKVLISSTDHLSDRELYTWLWEDGLREETPDPQELGGALHTSPIGAGNDEDTQIYLKYYASDEERQRWHEQFSEDVMPPHEPLPYNRDHSLPRQEYG